MYFEGGGVFGHYGGFKDGKNKGNLQRYSDRILDNCVN